MSKNKSRDPLLYIQQPELAFPKAEMQQSYIVKKAELEQENLALIPIPDTEDKTQKESEHNHNSSQVRDRGTEKEVKETKEVSSSKSVIDKGEKTANKGDSKKEDLTPEAIQEAINQYNKQSQKEDRPSNSTRKQQSYSFKRVKSFKEMNTVERLNYLEHFPKLLPPVPCVFVTSNSSTKGYLVNKMEDSIEIKQFNDKKMQIPIEQLTEVKMIGLK